MKWQSFTNKQKTYIIAVGIVSFIILWSFFSAKILTSGLNRKDLAKTEDEQQAVVEGIILTETKDEEKYWEIYADNGAYDSTNEVATLNGVIANFYDANKVSMSVKSSKGSYNSKTKIVTLYEDTYVVIKDGLTLSADKLVWTGSEKPINAYGHVVVTKDNQLLSTADEIEISGDYSNIKIKGHTVSKVFEGKNENEQD